MGSAWFPLVVCALAFAPLGSIGTLATHGDTPLVRYVATGTQPAIYCPPGDGDPTPTNPLPGSSFDEIIRWAFSGDPQCTAGRTLWGEEVAYGHGGFPVRTYNEDLNDPAVYYDHRGEPLAVAFDDALGTATPWTVYISDYFEDDVGFEGCGDTVFVTPTNVFDSHWEEDHWQDVWFFLAPVGVEGDLSVCLGSTGTARVTIGA